MPLFVHSRQLFDPGSVPEISCSGLGRIEFMGGGQACYVLYRNTVSPARCDAEAQVCGRIFAPLEASTEAMQLMASALVEGGVVAAASWARRLRVDLH